jgi:hypothetical protein
VVTAEPSKRFGTPQLREHLAQVHSGTRWDRDGNVSEGVDAAGCLREMAFAAAGLIPLLTLEQTLCRTRRQLPAQECEEKLEELPHVLLHRKGYVEGVEKVDWRDSGGDGVRETGEKVAEGADCRGDRARSGDDGVADRRK